MAPIIRPRRCPVIHGLPVSLMVFLVLSAPVVAATESKETTPKRSAAMRAPIPLDALDKMPLDATAYCGDGTWSSVATKQAACASHGGIGVWFGPAPPGTTGRCGNGTYTRARKGTLGACSGAGNVKTWLSKPVPSAPKTP